MIYMVPSFQDRTRSRSKAKTEVITDQANLDRARSLNIPKLEWNNSSLIREISEKDFKSEMDFQLYQSVNVFQNLIVLYLAFFVEAVNFVDREAFVNIALNADFQNFQIQLKSSYSLSLLKIYFNMGFTFKVINCL